MKWRHAQKPETARPQADFLAADLLDQLLLLALMMRRTFDAVLRGNHIGNWRDQTSTMITYQWQVNCHTVSTLSYTFEAAPHALIML